MNVLVDTSVWSLAMRRKPKSLSAVEQSLVEEFRELVREGRVRLIGLVRQELMSGIKNSAQFEKLKTALRTFSDEPVDTDDHEAAAKASNECRSKGITVSVVDVLMCAVALRRELLIFTTDPDFKIYARVLPLKFHSPRDFSGRPI